MILETIREKINELFKNYPKRFIYVGGIRDSYAGESDLSLSLSLSIDNLVDSIIEKSAEILKSENINGAIYVVNSLHKHPLVITYIYIISFDNIIELNLTTTYALHGITNFNPSRKIHSLRKGVETKIINEKKLAVSYRRGTRYYHGIEMHDSIIELGNYTMAKSLQDIIMKLEDSRESERELFTKCVLDLQKKVTAA